MAWYPDAIVKEIPPGSNDPAIIPVGMVFHVRAGLGDSLYPYFNGPSGGIESHLYVRFDGTVEQYRSSTREADANYKGNSWVSGGKRYGLLSVETEGLEKGEWTDAQVVSLKRLYRWGMDVHGFPARVCPAWNASGLGYHVLFGAPGPWTPVAKSCPGPERVDQFDDIFRPWLAAGAPLGDTPAPEPDNPTEDWTDMAEPIYRIGRTVHIRAFGDQVVNVPAADVKIHVDNGIKVIGITAEYGRILRTSLRPENRETAAAIDRGLAEG